MGTPAKAREKLLRLAKDWGFDRKHASRCLDELYATYGKKDLVVVVHHLFPSDQLD
jgi:hypothetical protein